MLRKYFFLFGLFLILPMFPINKSAEAITIGFDSITPGTTWTTYEEDGFLVTAGSGQWWGVNKGDSAPDLFGYADDNLYLTVARTDGGEFTYHSIMLQVANTNFSTKYTGELGDDERIGGSYPQLWIDQGRWVKYVSLYLISEPPTIDLLTISFERETEGPSVWIDNIDVRPAAPDLVPEPTTIALLGIGLVGLAGAEVRRRRKKKAVDNS